MNALCFPPKDNSDVCAKAEKEAHNDLNETIKGRGREKKGIEKAHKYGIRNKKTTEESSRRTRMKNIGTRHSWRDATTFSGKERTVCATVDGIPSFLNYNDPLLSH